MRLSIDEIRTDPSFQLLDKLHYNSIVEFATQYIRKRTRSMIFYIIIILAFFVLQWSAFIYGITVSQMNTVSLLTQFLYGLIISITIIKAVIEITINVRFSPAFVRS